VLVKLRGRPPPGNSQGNLGARFAPSPKTHRLLA
jgi:hypothetical protein